MQLLQCVVLLLVVQGRGKEEPVRIEAARVSRGLLFLRLGLVAPFLLLAADSACAPQLKLALVAILLLLAVPPAVLWWRRPEVWGERRVLAGIAFWDLLLISLLNVLAVVFRGPPLFFPLYILLTVECTCWWGWGGALLSGAGGAAVLGILYFWLPAERANLGLAAAAVTMGWSIVLGYLVQWILGQWQFGQRLALQIAHHEDALNRIRDRLQRWEKTWKRLQQASTPQALLRATLWEAMTGTGSSLGLVLTRDPKGAGWRVEYWEGFRPQPGLTGLRPGDRVASSTGDATLEVRHLLHVPLRLQSEEGEELPALGQLYVARHEGPPYTDSDAIWLRILGTYTAILLDNLLLRGELGHIQEQADSLARAGWSLVTLSDPETALEYACRNVIAALGLERVVLFLAGRGGEPGCYVLTCPAEGTASTVWNPLQGRGLSLLRRLLSSGGPLVINRRSECPELFAEMGWDEPIQSVACFPLSIPEQGQAILCLLAPKIGAFSPYAQQSLAIFCGEVALALENACLRQTGTTQPEEAPPRPRYPFFAPQTVREAAKPVEPHSP